jgi:hypothetical protein
MSTFNYHIDTKPLAEEMGNVSKNVTLATGAMVSLQAAVVAAEERATEEVCDKVTRGFYSLIRSQISQKLAKCKSDFESKRMLLSHQKRALVNIQKRMERDYNMISSRYNKLFGALNMNLQTRIFELDKPIIEFSYKDIGKISNRSKYLTATIPVTQIESVSQSQKIVASGIKQQGVNVINSIKGFISQMSEQDAITREILVNDSINRNSQAYLPVVLCEYNSDAFGNLNIDIISPDYAIPESARTLIYERMYDEFVNIENNRDPQNWHEVKNEFNKLISNSKKPQRVKEIALTLFYADKPQSDNSLL